jgi:hypothetical protein
MITKIKFKDLPKNAKQAILKARTSNTMRIYPLFVLYSLTVIGLLKIAQIVLFK